jgi:hypothetical protein
MWGRGGNHNVFGDRPTKCPIAKKINQNICAFEYTTINMNHNKYNKYLSSCKCYNK